MAHEVDWMEQREDKGLSLEQCSAAFRCYRTAAMQLPAVFHLQGKNLRLRPCRYDCSWGSASCISSLDAGNRGLIRRGHYSAQRAEGRKQSAVGGRQKAEGRQR